MVIVIDEYIDVTNETKQRTIENVVDIQTSCSGPDGAIYLIQSNGNIEEMDIGDNFNVTRYTNAGVLIEPKAGD